MSEPSADIHVQERQETEVNLCLAGAQLAKSHGDYRRSEKLYRRAIKWGIQRWGRKSANVGVILLELQELYELQGLTAEVENLDHEISAVLRSYFFSALRKMNAVDNGR
ncbi:MAG TPA: hypothetical protein V6C97_28885 [Oculatellaceae cyanobacterium]